MWPSMGGAQQYKQAKTLKEKGKATQKVTWGYQAREAYRPAEAWKFEPFMVSVLLFPT